MNRYERKIRAVDEQIRKEIDDYRAIYKNAEQDDRDPSDEERLDIESHLKAIETLKVEKQEAEAQKKTLDEVKAISDSLGPAVGDGSALDGIEVVPGGNPIDRNLKMLGKSMGEQFTESESFQKAFKTYKEGGQKFDSGPVMIETKAGTVFEGAQGAGLIPVPQVIPGVVETLFQRLTVEQLLMSGQTSVNSLRYIVEGTATNSAAAVAEGGAKPASDLALSTKDEPVKKVATFLTVSDEMLEDVQQVQGYINGRLSLFVQIQSEASIVGGAGTNDLVGLTAAARGANIYPRGTTDNNAVALFKAMNGQRGSAFLEPDFIVMNPANWQTTRLLVDNQGQFYGGGPFMGAYGQGDPVIGNSSQLGGPNDYLWGKPIIVTTAVGAGTALVGTTSAAQVWARGGLTVEATNSHASYFANNLVAIRAERRLALALYRPAAFTVVTGLS